MKPAIIPTPTDLDALLDAGAVLPPGAPVAAPDTVDTLFTRAYQHPVLEGRTVIRLVPATLEAAEDLSMEFLGFPPPARVAEVGTVGQQALGFPAWALVHDPANGHHALALVKEIERLARVAQSRIGPAKEGFDTLGQRLSLSVPHFLPTYYEEAGRAFLTAGSPSYAAMMFGKAREAEQVYALTIDEDRQHAVFLEFALAGALTAKALSTHARALAARSEPAAAYERFRRLCVERTLGGLAPYSGMVADLRRLAKVARLNQADADEQVLRELVAAPTLTKAPEAFWTAYRPTLIRLARADAALRGRLLTFFPEHCADVEWLRILTESGAVDALTAPAGTIDPAAEPTDGPAGWFSRYAQRRRGRGRRTSGRLVPLYELLTLAADRLRADGVPLTMCRRWASDLDLLDLALTLGLPVADPPEEIRFPVDGWLSDTGDGRRELTGVAADPRFLPFLVKAVEEALPASSDRTRVLAVLAVPGLRVPLSRLLDEVAHALAQQGLPTVKEQLNRVRKLAVPEVLAVNPAAVARIVGYDLAPVFGRTLRAGVLDEYGWPALEEYLASSVPPPKKDEDEDDDAVAQVTQWPDLVVRHGDQVAVVGTDRVLFTHHLRIPATQSRYLWMIALRYVDGQLLVSWDTGPDRSAYWSGTAGDVVTGLPLAAFTTQDSSLPLTGGGRTGGGRPLHVGDRSQDHSRPVFTDGSAYWTVQTDQAHGGQAHGGQVHGGQVHEYDPATGDLGRASLPAFFEAGAVDGEALLPSACLLRPAAGHPASPLGQADGMVGWRVRRTPENGWAGEGIDGRGFRLVPHGGDVSDQLIGAVRFPGSDEVHGLLHGGGWRRDTLAMVSADGFVLARLAVGSHRPPLAAGTPLVPRSGGWHQLRPRDPIGSAALRAFTDEQARALLDAVTVADGDAAARAAVTAVLPQLTHPELIAGVAGVARLAAKRAARLADLAALLSGAGGPVVKEPVEPVSGMRDDVLMPALAGLIPYCYDRGTTAATLITVAGAALTDGVTPTEKTLSADHDWFDTLSVLPAVLYRSVSPLVSPVRRRTLLDLLELCAGTGLLAAGSRLRRLSLLGTVDPAPVRGTILEVGTRRLLVLSQSSDVQTDPKERRIEALDFAPDGQFGPVPGYRIIRATDLTDGTLDTETVTAFVAQARDCGPLAWRPELVGSLSERAGVSVAEALLLLTGFPDPDDSPTEPDDTRADLDAPVIALAEETVDGTTPPEPDPAPVEPAGLSVRDALTELGLSVTAGTIAAESWKSIDRRGRARLLGSLLPPTDLSRLWTDGPALAGIDSWIAVRGTRTPIRDDLIVSVHQAKIAAELGASELLHGLRSPAACSWLAPAGQVPGKQPDPSDVLIAIGRSLPWLAYHLPFDDELRHSLPDALAALRARMADPGYTVELGYLKDDLAGFAADLGMTVAVRDGQAELGPFVLPDAPGNQRIRLRPALLSGPDDAALSAYEARAYWSSDTLVALRLVLSAPFAALIAASVPAGETASGRPPQDPTSSAPQLVTEVASALGLSADAATLYLQLLALPDPTDRNVARWTGWKPARLTKARAELAATPLVTEAKRSRAGRSLFLPGGWLALKSPHTPLELWKAPMVSIDGDAPRLDSVVPTVGVPELFALAWSRVQAGDGPRFDELNTGRRR